MNIFLQTRGLVFELHWLNIIFWWNTGRYRELMEEWICRGHGYLCLSGALFFNQTITTTDPNLLLRCSLSAIVWFSGMQWKVIFVTVDSMRVILSHWWGLSSCLAQGHTICLPGVFSLQLLLAKLAIMHKHSCVSFLLWYNLVRTWPNADWHIFEFAHIWVNIAHVL